jgi:predicted tellurium resistance membrane protein TerC
MKHIDDIMGFFEYGLLKSVACMAGSAVSFLASGITNGVASEAAGVTGWALAITCIIFLARTVKHLFERLEAKDKRIEELHGQVLKATVENKDEE